MRVLRDVAGAALLIALLAPLAFAAWMSFTPSEVLTPPTTRWSLHWYERFAASPEWTTALDNSLRTAALSALLSVLIGAAAAVAFAGRRFRGRGIAVGLMLTPMFVPAVALGLGLLPVIHALGIFGTTLSIATAHSLGSLPVVFLIVLAALEETNPDLTAAARGLGAGPWRTFARVTLPLTWPALAAAAAASFVLSLNEFTLTFFLATPATATLPVIVWPNLRYSLSPLVAAASGVSLIATIGGMALVWACRERWLR
jgi:ABC-type spermidine/putrescine transport system permease subunit II